MVTMLRSRYRLPCLGLLLLVGGPGIATGQSIVPPSKSSGVSAQESLAACGAAFTGKWTYRSFISDPAMSDPAAPLSRLLFGQGQLDVTVDRKGILSGTLGGDGWQLLLTGTAHAGNPISIRFQGKGVVGGEQWVYDYLGYAVPKWPNGVHQRPAIVGTIVRTVPHSDGSGGVAPAGYVAQWIAVQQDATTRPNAAIGRALRADDPKQQLQQLETGWAAAVETNDPDKIAQFLGAAFVFVGPRGILQDRKQHLDDFRTGKLKVASITLQQMDITTYDDVAVVNSQAMVKGTYDGRDITGEYSFLDTWRLLQGRWLAVARKQKLIPQNPPQAKQPLGQPVSPLLRQMYLEEQERANKAAIPAPRQAQPPARPLGSLQPETIHSANGRLDLTLEVNYETIPIGKDNVRLRTYNHKPIGPVLRIKAGDVLYLTLINRLLPLDPAMHLDNGHHAWNTTNIHFHGLHVAPQGPAGHPDEESDNVLLELKPSDPFDPSVSVQKYKVRIPLNHVAGTFWYHAHKHGSVAAQVSSGLAGALIIERDDSSHNLDRVPEIAAAAEELFVLQEVPYLKDPSDAYGQIEIPLSSDPELNLARMFAPGAFRKLKRYITVNGQKIPTITMAPGEVRRLRFVYTGQRESAKLRIERAPQTTGPGADRLDLNEIAVDGLPTGSIRTISDSASVERDRVLELFPGYRSDVLLQPPANTTGEFYLVDTANDVNGAPRPDTGADGSPEPVRWVARIIVAGQPKAMTLPQPAALRPHRLTDLTQTDTPESQYAFYGIDFSDNGGFFISRNDLSQMLDPVSPANAKSYDPTDARFLVLGKTQKWLIGSRNGMLQGQLANVTHPFHIHTNPFQITKVTKLDLVDGRPVATDVTAQEIGQPNWRDTLAMKQGYTYELLTRYDDYCGKFVDHCHILDHEDRGMMDLVEIRCPADLTSQSRRRSNSSSVPAVPGIPSVLVFVRGSFCPHCMAQLSTFARELSGQKINVLVISASGADDLKAFPKAPFHLLADPDLKLFKAYGVADGGAQHATIVLDAEGAESFRNVGEKPLQDASLVLRALQGARTSAAP